MEVIIDKVIWKVNLVSRWQQGGTPRRSEVGGCEAPGVSQLYPPSVTHCGEPLLVNTPIGPKHHLAALSNLHMGC